MRAKDATGGGLWGLFTNGGRVEGNYRITAQEVDLVAIDSGTSTVVGTCKYERATDDAKTDRDQILITSNVTIYDRKTGAKIASKVFDPGTHPGCKAEILSASGNFIKEVERAEIEAWAKSFLSDDFVPGVDDAERPSNEAPKLDGLSQQLTQLTRLSQGYLGFQRGMAPAKVEAIVGAGEVLSDSASSRLRTYLNGGLQMAYALPDDGLESVTVVNQATWDALAAKGLKDPVLDLFNQPFDAAAKLLGKPSTAETNHYEWLLDEGKLSTYVSLDYFEGRCGSVGLTWLLRQ